MRAALLCPGPSLPRFWDDGLFDDYDCVIGINTAGHKYLVHWVAGADAHIIKPILDKRVPIPLCGLVTNPTYGVLAAKRHYLKWIPQPLCQKEYVSESHSVASKALKSVICAYTMPNALSVAIRQAAGGPVDVYGFDCTHTVDFSGQTGDHTRQRWRIELTWLRSVWKPEQITIYGEASQAVRDYVESKSDKNPFA